MHYKYFITLLLFFGIQQAAKANFVFNSNSIAAYQALFDLRFNDARKYIRDEKINNPQNGIPVLLENYLDYLFLLTSEMIKIRLTIFLPRQRFIFNQE